SAGSARSTSTRCRPPRVGPPCRYRPVAGWAPGPPAVAAFGGPPDEPLPGKRANHRLGRVLFPTVEFAAFFAAVLVVNWRLMPRPALWRPSTLLASSLCYGWPSPRLLLVLVAVTAWTQAMGTAVWRTHRRWVLVAGIAGDVAVLAYA